MNICNSQNTHNKNIYAKGILFDCNENIVKKQKFAVYDLNRKYLGTGKTSTNGTFYTRLSLQPNLTELDVKTDLVFRLCTERKDPFTFFKVRHETQEVVLRNVNLNSNSLDLGSVVMEQIFEKDQVPLSYLIDIASTAIPAVAINVKERAEILLHKYTREEAIDKIQEDHEVTLTELSPQNSWKMVTNGICPMDMIETDDYYVAAFIWDEEEFDTTESLPNVWGYFKKLDHGDPVLEKIEVQFRKTLAPSSDPNNFEPKYTYLSTDANFEEGIRKFNSCAHLEGQLKFHLSLHMWAARMAQLVHDHLHGTVLGGYLEEHFKESRIIGNEIGDAFVSGPNGVLNQSALSTRGIATKLSKTYQAFNPFDYKYVKQLTQNHHFAVNDTEYHNGMSEAATKFVNTKWRNIMDEWQITHPFLRKLRKTSPLYEEYNFANDALAPSKKDKTMLSQLLALCTHIPTFRHSYIHGMQYAVTPIAPNILDQNTAPIAMKNHGEGKYGGLTVESALAVATTQDVFRNYRVKNHLLLKNPNVSSFIKDEVQERKAKLLQHGFDVDNQLMVSISI